MTDDKMLYVVMGTTGEYSDRDEWPVAAYEEKELAELHVTLAEKRANELAAAEWRSYDGPKKPNEYDPDMEMDYTGTRYFYYEVPLRDGVTPATQGDS